MAETLAFFTRICYSFPMPNQGKKKILLLEDEETLAEMYRAKFEREGLQIDVLHDGESGMQKAKESQYDAVLVDIIMPKLDGFGVIRALRALPNYKDTPIILLSNLGQDEDISKGKSIGATDYLVKANFTPAQVVKKVNDLMAK